MLALFAVHSSQRFVHVTEVARGLACDCRCAVCGEPVLAKQGDVREHHFAHASHRQPCASSYECDLHRFAKQVISEADGLNVPFDAALPCVLGSGDGKQPFARLTYTDVQQEVMVGNRRPDVLAITQAGVRVAIEIAYSSFCDFQKRQDYEDMRLPGLEIDMRRFTPQAFDVVRVKQTVLEEIACKRWLWSECLVDTKSAVETPASHTSDTFVKRRFAPEEIVRVHGHQVSIKQLPSGDIAIKALRYHPDVVAVIRAVARRNFGTYQNTHFSWLIPQRLSESARCQMREVMPGIKPNISKSNDSKST